MAPELTDAEGIFDLRSAYNTAVVGFADCTLDEVADGLAEPGFERATDGLLVLAADGRPVGYATTFGKGDGVVIEIEVVSQEQAAHGTAGGSRGVAAFPQARQ